MGSRSLAAGRSPARPPTALFVRSRRLRAAGRRDFLRVGPVPHALCAPLLLIAGLPPVAMETDAPHPISRALIWPLSIAAGTQQTQAPLAARPPSSLPRRQRTPPASIGLWRAGPEPQKRPDTDTAGHVTRLWSGSGGRPARLARDAAAGGAG